MNKKIDQHGFTLIELMLAMTLFIFVMVVATVGFVGINRTFSKGLARKNLSEAVQKTVEDVTRTVRANPGGLDKINSPKKSLPASTNAYCGSSICYVWNTDPKVDLGGLYRMPAVDDLGNYRAQGLELVDSRYFVETLKIEPIEGEKLYRVRGVFRSNDEAAFVFTDTTESGTPVRDPFQTICKGSAQEGVSQNCALEKFNFVVSTSIKQTDPRSNQ
jgi:prepilin-type N-terminal cleavage/methylation domain-containing protein